MLKQIQDIILYYDQVAWYHINCLWRNDFLDFVLPFMRNQYFWAPLYLFLIIYMPQKYKSAGWFWCLGFFISFVISDSVSASIMKPYFARLRPCHNPALVNVIHLIVPCGGMYSFPSSHAANHFSIGMFSAITLGHKHKWIWYAAPFWAALVAYSQVYVGVHYPLDITVGALIGLLTATITGKIFNRYFKKYFIEVIIPERLPLNK